MWYYEKRHIVKNLLSKSGRSISEPALNGEISVLLPDLPLKGDSLSAVKYDQNYSKSRSFKVEEFCDQVFYAQMRQKRSKSLRIYEYFNEIWVEKTIPKSDSDMLHPLWKVGF